jgi:hypothetical protein
LALSKIDLHRGNGILRPEDKPPKMAFRRLLRKRNLDVTPLQARMRNVRRRSSPHLPRRLSFRVLAYRPQAERLGDLNVES